MFPIQKVVRTFASEPTADSKEDPSFENLMALPSSDINMMATWLTEKVEFLGSDSLSSMPDKVRVR